MTPLYAFRRLRDGRITLCDPERGDVLVTCKGRDGTTESERSRAAFMLELRRRQTKLAFGGAP